MIAFIQLLETARGFICIHAQLLQLYILEKKNLCRFHSLQPYSHGPSLMHFCVKILDPNKRILDHHQVTSSGGSEHALNN